ncbi:MAG: glycerate kinase [Saprospiraceae bacterium]
MKILIALDKFKASLSATQAVASLAQGIQKKYPTAILTNQAMADGGDGSIDLLHEQESFTEHHVEVHDPLFRKIKATYFSNQTDAFIEMAKASGLALLTTAERNPMETTSLGTGELILDAFHKGFKNINLFIGGSATNDGGIGIAQALGFNVLDKNQNQLRPIGKNLSNIQHLQSTPLSKQIANLNIRLLCDVNNPFCGVKGAAQVYARQKGATPTMVNQLDQGLAQLALIFTKERGIEIGQMSGAGAAGGIGGGMVALFGAQLISGVQFFVERFDLEAKIKEADVVISGEGQLDLQSLQGKVVGGILQLCLRHQKPLIVVCGQSTLPLPVNGIQTIKTIMDYAPSVAIAMQKADHFLQTIGAQLNFPFTIK